MVMAVTCSADHSNMISDSLITSAKNATSELLPPAECLHTDETRRGGDSKSLSGLEVKQVVDGTHCFSKNSLIRNLGFQRDHFLLKLCTFRVELVLIEAIVVQSTFNQGSTYWFLLGNEKIIICSSGHEHQNRVQPRRLLRRAREVLKRQTRTALHQLVSVKIAAAVAVASTRIIYLIVVSSEPPTSSF